MTRFSTMIATLCLFLPLSGMALDSDRDAPVAIQADTTDIDFRTGTRTLTGNVVIDQGSMHIEADKVIVQYDGNKLDTATAWGKPVRFKQLPEGKDEEVHGEGLMLKLEQKKNLVTLKDKARLSQGDSKANGRVIYYNTVTSKMTIKGQPRGQQKTAAAAKPGKAVEQETAAGGRTRIIIRPDTIKQP
jgi:lipopolysaccharide export system protein LptA